MSNSNLEIARNLLDRASEFVYDLDWWVDFKELIKTPSNPNLSAKALALLNKLYFLQGKTTLTGQHEYLEAPYQYTSQILTKTGYEPMVKGVEFGGIMGQDATTLANQRRWVVDACKAWDLKNGIVTATYHAAYPGSSQTWDNVKRSSTQVEFDQIVTPGTSLYNALIDDIDKVAVSLKALRDANVPVLWRPYHEMNGGWFWWGKKSNFKALWDIMYDRYVNYHNLNNLIWVWCPNAKNEWCDAIEPYYVGTTKLDVLALDIYSNDFKQSHHDSLLLLGKGKLMAIGENGELPNIPSKLATTQRMYSWMLTWGSMLNENNTDSAIKAFYANPYVLKLGQEYSEFGDGLNGEYFNGTNFDTLVGTRIDDKISFNWGGGKPIPASNADNFSIRWTGFIVPTYSEIYKFSVHSDDGVRVKIGDQVVVQRWSNGDSWASGFTSLVLQAGTKYPITIEYFDSTGAALIDLYWGSPSQATEIVPKENLYTK